MFWLKACRKCQGDLYKGEDPYGSFISCIQCSHYLTEEEESQLMGSSQDMVGLTGSFSRLGNLAA